MQVAVLQAITRALTGIELDYAALEPISPAEVAAALDDA